MYAMKAVATLILDGDMRQTIKIFGVAADQWGRFSSNDDQLRGLALDEHEQLDLIHSLRLARPTEATARPIDPASFKAINNAAHYHSSLVNATVSGPTLSITAMDLNEAIVAKIGPVCSRHEGHPRLMLPMSQDPYWKHYLIGHSDTVLSMALQWMRLKMSKPGFNAAMANQTVKDYEVPAEGPVTQLKAWR